MNIYFLSGNAKVHMRKKVKYILGTSLSDKFLSTCFFIKLFFISIDNMKNRITLLQYKYTH